MSSLPHESETSETSEKSMGLLVYTRLSFVGGRQVGRSCAAESGRVTQVGAQRDKEAVYARLAATGLR